MTGMAQAEQRFQLEQALGWGRFWHVYLARDTALDLQVVVRLAAHPDLERALRVSGRMMGRIGDLRHPNVVTIRGLHEIDGRLGLVVEYVGPSLRTRVGNIEEHPHSPMPAEQAFGIALQLCRGLNAVHGAFADTGVFHGDIKPEIVLIRESDGVVKIDFLPIALLRTSFGVGGVYGTPPYMAPELLRGDAGADQRADVYAAGVTLYEMLTGCLPFWPFDDTHRPKRPMEYAQEICSGSPRSPAEVAHVDSGLSDVVLKAMHRDVDERYQSAMEFHDALNECAAGLPSGMAPVQVDRPQPLGTRTGR